MLPSKAGQLLCFIFCFTQTSCPALQCACNTTKVFPEKHHFVHLASYALFCFTLYLHKKSDKATLRLAGSKSRVIFQVSAALLCFCHLTFGNILPSVLSILHHSTLLLAEHFLSTLVQQAADKPLKGHSTACAEKRIHEGQSLLQNSSEVVLFARSCSSSDSINFWLLQHVTHPS